MRMIRRAVTAALVAGVVAAGAAACTTSEHGSGAADLSSTSSGPSATGGSGANSSSSASGGSNGSGAAASGAQGPGQTAARSVAPPVPTCTKAGSPQTPLTMSVVNTSSYPDDEVYVALTGVTLAGFKSWDANPRDLINTSVPLSCLPVDPSVPGGHAHTFQLGEGIGSGLLWISLGAPITSGLPGTQPSFDTTSYRFANVEFAYPGQGDMTNVDQFSFPVNLDTFAAAKPSTSAAPLESSNYAANTCTIVSGLKKTVQANASATWSQVRVGDPSGNFVRVVSPKQRAKQLAKNGTTPNPYAQGWPDMSAYAQSMAGKTVTVKGLFTPGAGSAYYGQTGWYSYTAVFDKSGNVSMSGSIHAPIAAGPGGKGSAAGQSLGIAANGADTNAKGDVVANDDLVAGIYDQSSRYSVGGAPRNGMTKGVSEPDAPDDVYNSIYRDFITAFTYGYWGGVYGSSNSAFWHTFVPPGAPSGGQPAFAAARPKTDPAGLVPYSIWSQTMFQYSDDYNIPYGEDYGSGAPSRPSPLMDVPVGGTWRMTIGSDGPAGCLDGL